MLIARLIAEPATLEASLESALSALAACDMPVADARMLEHCGEVLQIDLPHGKAADLRRVLDAQFGPCDLLVSDNPIEVPRLFVSDMDSTMIGQECIDELADFAGLKDKVAAITERAMRGELEFESALRERVALLQGLSEDAIAQCLTERIAPSPGARVLVATLAAKGCRSVLVTGGFHQFADPVGDMIGFERVVGNRLATDEGRLTGDLVGAISDSGTKARTLAEESEHIGDNAVTLAMGDGANDVPMLQAAAYGMAYRAKPTAREQADGWIERGDLTAMLKLLGIPEREWVAGE
ncbi:phosphoserine phosphatase SerB [Pseudoblastomonas halimionae]|uniref:phosphoserine phosphatase SerB n=1 Tax=Alteriqipengyuania halimionae TaxID=1926630 RepID=UPI001F326E3B|nr:phosphoserine phosphatase SerB [Alteriqipengyuania halimionae]